MAGEVRIIEDLDPFLDIARVAFHIRPREVLREYLGGLVSRGAEPWGIYHRGNLQAGAVLYPFRMRLRAGLVDMGGVGFLCSSLDARGHGFTRTLLVELLRIMREKDQAVSVLYPFSLDFYRKYGWEIFSRERRIRVRTRDLAVEPPGGIEAKLLPFPDETAQEFYNAYARGHYTLAQRGQLEWWKALFTRDDEVERGVVALARGEGPVGLIVYSVPEEGSRMVVHLFIGRDEEARRAGLAFLSRLTFQFEEIEFLGPPDLELWPYLREPPVEDSFREPAMLRIVSLEALDGLPVAAEDMEITLAVEDPQAPWNRGAFTLVVEGGRLRVRRGGRPVARVGVGGLSTVLSGFTTFGELAAAGKAEVLSPEYSGQDLPRRLTWLADHF